MKSKRLLTLIGEIDDRYIEEAAPAARKHMKAAWVKWVGIAACLCLIVTGTAYFANRAVDSEVQKWSPSTLAADYFRNSHSAKGATDSAAKLIMPPYAVSVSLDSTRSELEKEGILPAMPKHTEQSFRAEYNGNGSLYKVTFLWMRRGSGLDGYSDLELTAASKEPHEISDVYLIPSDSDGVSVTERDGILIYAEGKEQDGKTISWQTEQGWYQITGSRKDSYEDMIALLDWFWAHPLSLSRFDTPDDGVFVFSNRAEQPDSFRTQIPDFGALGYTAETERVHFGLHDGNLIPVWFEGIYSRGETRIRWTISIGADADAWSACLGRPNEVTEEMVSKALEEKQYLNLFFDSPCMATLLLEQGTSTDAWEIIQTFQ